LGGLVLATFALGSLVGGLVAGARPAADYLRRGLTFAAVYPFVAMALALAWSIPSICVIVFFAGLPFAPMVAGFYGLVDRIAPFGAVAEAFAWLGTAITLGIAFGSAAAGPLIDHVGVKAPFVVGPLAALAGVGLVAGRRGLLRVADA
jgi:predicted MFS family arabinose efflux permease